MVGGGIVAKGLGLYLDFWGFWREIPKYKKSPAHKNRAAQK
jgi:hypothetical protein